MLRPPKTKFAGLFLLNLLLSALFYWPSLHSRFVYDINKHFIDYERYGIQGLWNCWGENTIRWGINCVNYAIWRLFGASDIAWFVIFIAFHAFVGTLLYRLVSYFSERLSLPFGNAISLLAMLLFLLSPYHSETIVWGATLFYITFTVSLLGIMLCFIRYAQDAKRFDLVLIYALYLYEMLTFEVFLVVPVICIILHIMLRKTGGISLSIRRLITLFILPQIGVICFYFLWNKIRVGQIVGHYGTAAHFRFDVWMITANFVKYLLKFSFIHLFIGYGVRDRIYALLDQHSVILALLVVCAASVMLAAWLAARGRITAAWYVLLGWFALFLITLLPVLNLFFPFNKDVEQERYLYVPALFFYSFLIMLLFQVLRKAAYPVAIASLIISIFFLHRNVGYWEQNGKIFNSLISDFRWPDAKRIFILQNGDNYNGAYMMRDMPQSAFAEMLHVQRGIDITDRSFDLLQYNVNTPDDSTSHEVIDSNTIKLTFGQWGNWYWYKSFGAESYDSTLYKVTIDEWKHSFTAQFKDKRPGDVYIYQSKDKWIEVKGF